VAGKSIVPVGGASCTDTRAPYTRYARHQPRFRRGRPNRLFGTATDRGCRGRVTRVQVAVAERVGPKHARCRFMRSQGRFGHATSCARHVWLRARGTSKWDLRLRLPRGYYKVWARALDASRHVEHVSRQNVRTFRVT
jgi:hypothetical protein